MYYASKIGLKKIYERVCYYHKQYRKYYCNHKIFAIFSSPEHEVLIVSYCDQSLSVVCTLSTFCFKRLLLQNSQTDFVKTNTGGFLGRLSTKIAQTVPLR